MFAKDLLNLLHNFTQAWRRAKFFLGCLSFHSGAARRRMFYWNISPLSRIILVTQALCIFMGIFILSLFLSRLRWKRDLKTFLFHIFIEKFVFSFKTNNQNKCNNRFTTSHDARNQAKGERYKFHGKYRSEKFNLFFSAKLKISFRLIESNWAKIEICAIFKTFTLTHKGFSSTSKRVSIISFYLNSWIIISIYLVNTICHGAKGA